MDKLKRQEITKTYTTWEEYFKGKNNKVLEENGWKPCGVSISSKDVRGKIIAKYFRLV